MFVCIYSIDVCGGVVVWWRVCIYLYECRYSNDFRVRVSNDFRVRVRMQDDRERVQIAHAPFSYICDWMCMYTFIFDG